MYQSVTILRLEMKLVQIAISHLKQSNHVLCYIYHSFKSIILDKFLTYSKHWWYFYRLFLLLALPDSSKQVPNLFASLRILRIVLMIWKYDRFRNIMLLSYKKDIGYVTGDDGAQEDGKFFYKFEVLTLLHAYVEQLIDYLVLYYCCFSWKPWIAVFYPFIESGIGSKQCEMLFATTNTHGQSEQSTSLYDQALDLIPNNIIKYKIGSQMKANVIFKRILRDTYSNNITDDSLFQVVDSSKLRSTYPLQSLNIHFNCKNHNYTCNYKTAFNNFGYIYSGIR